MKYILIDQIKNGDCFSKESDNLAEIENRAKIEFSHMTAADKSRREFFGIIESANPDEEADNHFDGNIIIEYR